MSSAGSAPPQERCSGGCLESADRLACVVAAPMWLLLAAGMPQAVAGVVTRLPMTVLHVKPAMPRSSLVIAQYGGYGGQQQGGYGGQQQGGWGGQQQGGYY